MIMSTEEPSLSMCPQHSGQKLYYLCLEEKCSKQRIICRKCVRQFHQKHRIGAIDKLLDPLNRLNKNSFHPEAEFDYSFLNNWMEKIQLEWESLTEVINQHMREIQSGFLEQLEFLTQTFKQDKIDQVYELLTQPNPDSASVDNIVKQINFLGKESFQDVESIKKVCEEKSKFVVKSISKTKRQIEKWLNHLQDHIIRLDLTRQDNSKTMEEIQDPKPQERHEQGVSSSKAKGFETFKEVMNDSEQTSDSRTRRIQIGLNRAVQRNK